ncbi:ribosomal protein S5 [Pichia kudriavzevii]|uniref:Small ribosomal subunit protein uS5 n=1 Tax=Pichia kudriavzevii TaxID=4909 RepID=A0A099NWF2_PICKU|nr:uncharacterized protein C5L36_0A09390 [Pichia kudriavzevii]AWU74347.1 hypothetical protein C5L36_0A09390 [Pichia kudriavzevii]KGK37143.1 hypothetical protein JL09_g3727 [Pichia kudriavzevii]ONH71491.1 hypothetical protein BOH78_4471 [Pichia kudriavzevii]OUT20653.1 ribosomal protein S5 [Pichia kudriavzevii]
MSGAAPQNNRGPRRNGPRRNNRQGPEEKAWVPVTKLGRLVASGKITSIEQIYTYALPIKEYQIVDKLLPNLQEKVMAVLSVQKQTRAGQRTRMKVVMVLGDGNGHVGLGVKAAKELANAIRGAIIIAKLSIIPVRRGYWGSNLGAPHTIAQKTSGKCGSVNVRLIPAPRGSGIVASPNVKQLLQFAGIEDIYTTSSGSTRTAENTLKATFAAIGNTYGFLTPNFWADHALQASPLDLYVEKK